MPSPKDIAPRPGWSLTVYSDAGSTQTLALTSPNPATATIATASFSNPVKLSNDSEDTGGTSIDDTTKNIQQVNYTPSGGTASFYAKCASPSSTPPGHCKIRFHYTGSN